MAFKGKADKGSGSQWYDASVVYGNSGGFQYGKSAHVKTNTGWQQVWTDCRLYDAAGGRGWSDPVDVITYTDSCNSRTQTTTTTRTKLGCPDDVRAVTVASPNCINTCYDAPTVTEEYYDGSCDTRRLRTKTITNPKSTSGGCGSSTTYGSPYESSDCNGTCYDAVTTAEVYYDGFCAGRRLRTQTTTPHKSTNNCTNTVTYGEPYVSATCAGGCTTANTVDFEHNGDQYFYAGTPGNFTTALRQAAVDTCAACPPGTYAAGNFTVTTCNGVRSIIATDCGTCEAVFG